MKPKNLILGLFILISLFIYDRFNLQAYAVELIGFSLLLLFFYHYSKEFRLNSTLFSLIIVSMVLHSMGVFGFYAKSPVFVPWDHVTHFIPILIFSIVFFNFLEPYMSKKFDVKSFFLILIVLLAALGVGSLVENFEFIGFNIYGFGEGGLGFGAGDAFPGQEVSDQIESFVGGWYNAMWDLVNNLLGALLGVVIMTVRKWF